MGCNFCFFLLFCVCSKRNCAILFLDFARLCKWSAARFDKVQLCLESWSLEIMLVVANRLCRHLALPRHRWRLEDLVVKPLRLEKDLEWRTSCPPSRFQTHISSVRAAWQVCGRACAPMLVWQAACELSDCVELDVKQTLYFPWIAWRDFSTSCVHVHHFLSSLDIKKVYCILYIAIFLNQHFVCQFAKCNGESVIFPQHWQRFSPCVIFCNIKH